MGCQNSKSVHPRDADAEFMEVDDGERRNSEGGGFVPPDNARNTMVPMELKSSGLRAEAEDGAEAGEDGDTVYFYKQKPRLSVPSYLTYTVTEESQDQELNIENLEQQPVFFKVKTTHPRMFAVVPNRGRIDPKSSLNVRVAYKPANSAPSALHREKVKLMVQGVNLKLPEHHDHLPQELWTLVPKDSISNNVIKVVFETEPEEELDLTKFKSVTVKLRSSESESRLWWKD